MTEDPESAIRASWRDNAGRWVRAVREGRIASRRAVTDRAIVEAVVARSPRLVLDAGCGEGWLVRALAECGIEADGFDAEPALIEAARAAGPKRARFWVQPFGARPPAWAGARAGAARYDAVVLNFALLGGDTAAVLRWLAPAGRAIVIQTLNPASFDAGASEEGWKTESFAALSEPGLGEWTAMPWYFRTLAGWRAVAAEAGLEVSETSEPRHPETGAPASLILVLECDADRVQS